MPLVREVADLLGRRSTEANQGGGPGLQRGEDPLVQALHGEGVD